MSKSLTIGGMVVAAVVFLLFTADLAVGFPFARASSVLDVGLIVGAALLGWLSWSTFQEIK